LKIISRKTKLFFPISSSLRDSGNPRPGIGLADSDQGSGWETYSFSNNTLVVKMFADSLYELHLFFKGKAGDGCFDNSAKGDFVHRNEAVVVHVRKESHNKLAIHAIRNSAMPWNRIAEVLDFEGTFEAGGKEAAEWGNERSERSKYENVNLHWCHVEGLHVWKPDWKVVEVRYEDGVGCTFKTCENIRAKILAIVRSDIWSSGCLLTLTGHMKYLYRIKTLVMPTPKIMVRIQAPTNPSTVFLGDNLMSCVRPNVIPQMYAKISLQITKETGRKNQIIPSKTLFIIKCA
jgi:hypothetical protein